MSSSSYSANNNSFSFNPALAVGATYSVTVQAMRTVLGSSVSSPVSTQQAVDLTAPASPGLPTVTATSSRLSWTASTSSSSNTTVSYEVQVSVNGTAFAAVNGSPFSTQSTSITSTAGNKYAYQVRAVATRYGQKSYSAWTPAIVVNTVAALSTGLTATPTAANVTPKGIVVSWTNTSSNLLTPLSAAFTVQRQTANNGNWVIITPVLSQNASVYSFTDTTGVAGTSYSYRVMASGAAGSAGYTQGTTNVKAP